MAHVSASEVNVMKASWCPRKQKKTNFASFTKKIRTNPTETCYPI